MVGVRRVAGGCVGYSCVAGRNFGGRIFGGIAEVVGTECRNLGGGLALLEFEFMGLSTFRPSQHERCLAADTA